MVVIATLCGSPISADTLPVTGDAFTHLEKPFINFGAEEKMKVSNFQANRFGLVEFALDNVPDLPITQAILTMWVRKVRVEGPMELRPILEDWDEDTVTHNTVPLIGANAIVTDIFDEDAGNFVSVDVTEFLEDWQNGDPFFGIALVPDTVEPLSINLDTKENITTSHSMELELTMGVGSAEIENGSITNAKLANSAVNSIKVQDNSLTGADIAPNAIGNSELGPNSVASINVQPNTLTANDIAPDAIGGSELANNSVASANVVDNSISPADVGFGFAHSSTKGGIATNAASAANADLLDGLNSPQFVRSDTSDGVTGPYTFPQGTGTLMFLGASGTGTNNKYLFAHSPAFPNWGIFYNDVADHIEFHSGGTNTVSFDLTLGDVAQTRTGDGLVKAAVVVDIVFGISTIARQFGPSAISITENGTGDWTVDFNFQISDRFVQCTAGATNVGGIAADVFAYIYGPTGDSPNDTVNVRVSNELGALTHEEFTCVVY
jgi:hypothetical protein